MSWEKIVNKSQTLCGVVALACVAGAPLGANADLIGSRITLEGLLGDAGTFDDFEAYDIGDDAANVLFDPAGEIVNLLTSTSIANGQGPGLVKDGAVYTTTPGVAMQWCGNAWFGMDSKTIGGNSGGGYTAIEYTELVTAMGVDVQVFSGYGGAHQARVYDLSNNLVGVHDFSVTGGRYFFGWEYAAGIGRVEIDFLAYSWGAFIDDHQFGVAVPAPAALSMFGLAGLLGTRRRRVA